MMHSSTVKIRKRHIIRAGDMFYMNTSSKESCCLNPCISCKAAAAGRPVNPIYGLKFLESETDFAFEGHPAALTGSSGRFGRRLHHLPAGGGGRHQRQPDPQYRPADGNDPLRVRQTGQEHQSGQRTVRLDLRTISFQRNLEDKTGFVRDGSHLLQEIHSDGRYTYLNSYKPLAQVRDWATDEGES